MLAGARFVVPKLRPYCSFVTGGLTTPIKRNATTSPSGAFLPEPTKVPMGPVRVGGTITLGLLLGAAISKNIASFLEETELFVPADDDDDD